MHFTPIVRSFAALTAQSKGTGSEQDFEGSHDENDVLSVRLETSGADHGPWHQKSGISRLITFDISTKTSHQGTRLICSTTTVATTIINQHLHEIIYIPCRFCALNNAIHERLDYLSCAGGDAD
jgi:hypothetical protein